MGQSPQLTVGQCATLACLLEVSAPKPGNVHRSADFEDMTFVDFVYSATAIGPVLDQAPGRGVGGTVLAAVQATRRWVAVNTNLGTILLLAPLAAVPVTETISAGLENVLGRLTAADSAAVYEAIRLAQPGGLGRVGDLDVSHKPPADLRAAMAAAATRDLVARQYVNRFATVLHEVVPWLQEGLDRGWTEADAIIRTQLRLLSRYGDSLIARKCGADVAEAVAARAAAVLESGLPRQPKYEARLADFDFWLRCDAHRRNPGTTADLVGAGLFVLLRERRWKGPQA